jgi:hypothetical protein
VGAANVFWWQIYACHRRLTAGFEPGTKLVVEKRKRCDGRGKAAPVHHS